MANTIRGRVLEVRPTQSVATKSGSQFLKREIILDCTRFDQNTGAKFESYPIFTFTQNYCSALDVIKPGMLVDVTFDITGRRSTDPNRPNQYYNDVRGFRIAEVGAQPALTPQPQQMSQAHPQYQQPQQFQQTPYYQQQYPQQQQHQQFPPAQPQSYEPPF